MITEEGSKHKPASIDGFYGSADGFYGQAYDTEVMLNDIEQPKHLLVYDLGLGNSDQAWHSPLPAQVSGASKTCASARTKAL